MTELEIPFMERFREAMLDSRKTVTSRTKQYGKRGDQFEAFGAPFVILDVMRMPLWEVRDKWFKWEGVDSPEEFERVWAEIHPKKGFDPKQVVYLHRFVRRNILLATSSWPGHMIEDPIQW